jgi:hypothetical protein
MAAGAPQIKLPERPLRILAISELWQGGDSYAYVRAFRRAGHSVAVVDAASYLAIGWKSTWLRALRRAMEPVLVAEYNRDLIDVAKHLRPQLFFAFKGPQVNADAVRAIKAIGAIAINLYPDVSVMAHGKYLPQALPFYNWVFTTKSFGLGDMERELGIRNASFVPPAFDPEVHAPFALAQSDMDRYGADVSFIGTWSPKKERMLQRVHDALPGIKLRVWGSHWDRATASQLQAAIEHQVVIGAEYAKCIRASRINLGLLSEIVKGASSGDLITARTFHIPASGGFMLHERTNEVVGYFEEGAECALFSEGQELITKIRHYLDHDQERQRVAEAGRARCLASGYSVDARIDQIVTKYWELVGQNEAQGRILLP